MAKKIAGFTLHEGLSPLSQIFFTDSTLKPVESSLHLHNSRCKNVHISLECSFKCKFCWRDMTSMLSSEVSSSNTKTGKTDTRDKRPVGSLGGKTFVPLLLVRRPSSPRFGN